MFVFTLLDILCLCVYTNTAALLPPFNSPPGHTAHTPTLCAMYLLQPRVQVSICIYSIVWSITIIIQTRKEACMVHMFDMCRMPFPLKTQRHVYLCVMFIGRVLSGTKRVGERHF